MCGKEEGSGNVLAWRDGEKGKCYSEGHKRGKTDMLERKPNVGRQ